VDLLQRAVLSLWALSEGFIRLDVHLYLKKEAETVPETSCFIKTYKMDAASWKSITSVTHISSSGPGGA